MDRNRAEWQEMESVLKVVPKEQSGEDLGEGEEEQGKTLGTYWG